jgi:hypothetical protein
MKESEKTAPIAKRNLDPRKTNFAISLVGDEDVEE